MTPEVRMLRYAAFAAASIIANLTTQRIMLAIDDSALGFVTAVGLGTLVGLVLKYILDKRWIFFDGASGLVSHGRKFTLYTATGIVTTAIFWGTETAFWLIWRTTLAREAGAIFGLVVGYFIKYNLDRQFVFTDRISSGEKAGPT
ncbi:GtrA family protein [Rhizobium sp. KVB221]|uniref:GtrA family protein n=1 Tax=Rhizobium setariae TaxID=2801340 RepID=A0A937CLZ2_9HYPH|nr:GtrA family protein [Rhizobium setariae]MBL0373700.1 GtrA family protein [Rhizobium setariae]